MKAPILSPSFRWIPPDDDPAAFRERQRARIAAAERARQSNAAEVATKVKTITRRRA